ncbi:MAG: hypothetical protein D6778_08725 [Nitrospirae bacterium]|nr:MAG: hypothetical protein D6778_08725 [Nitrospirota bacterium]
MKKVFNLKDKLSSTGEVILGAEDTGSHACYLIYGVLGPREKGRLLKPGSGHEELFFVLKGEVALRGECELVLKEGQAVHFVGEETFYAENLTEAEAVYVIAGGHSEGRHH